MPTVEQGQINYLGFSLNGSDAAPELIDALLECSVDNSIHLPDTCTIRLRDEGFTLIDDARLQIGVAVVVKAGYEGKAELTPIFWGEIAGAELDLASHGLPTITLRCFDRSHRLHRGRQSRPFVQVTDADIFTKVAREAGFTPHASATTPVHEWVFQNNQTNWEFLSQRAAHNGYRLYLKGERDLYFEPVREEGERTLSLTWGQELRSFRPRVSASPQVESVEVRGWDPKTKAPIVAQYARPASGPQIQDGARGGQVAASSFGSAKMVIVDRPVHSQSEAQALARSVCDDIAGSFVEAEGLCFGEPTLKPGVALQIRNIGKRFSGQYFVTATNHVYTPSEGYTTLFSVSGKRPSTLLSLLDDAPGKRAPLGGNIVIGVVTDNLDPDNLGRVKVMYPWLSDEHQSYWARQSAPMAGNKRGFYFLPEINDEVLVAFEHGDIRRPYVIGALWNGVDTPVEGNSVAVSGGKVERRTIKTRIGHTLLLEDTGSKGEMSLTTSAGHKIRIRDDEDLILVEDKTGQNKITIKTSDNSITSECMGNFTVKAKGKVQIEGLQGVEVKTPMQVKVEGTAGVDMKSSAMMNLEATGPLTAKSSAITTVQGTLVKIN